ncbi:hypothetical protein [Escherichia coli]|uniref:hypothetical protein n=1 Tax=Escherichia coli TaxID=562 RepID=UPI00339D5CB9
MVETIMLCTTPRCAPYSLGFRVQGTEGLWMDVKVDLSGGQSPTAARWEPAEGGLRNRSPAMETLRRSGGRGRGMAGWTGS